MTVKYADKIAESGVYRFIKILFRWRGSMWKMILRDIIMFLTIYAIIYLSYTFLFTEPIREDFGKIANYCNVLSLKIPLSFLVGFYVSQVVSHFWVCFDTLPWPSAAALYTNVLIIGKDESSRQIRRTLMRYICCSFTLTMRCVSPSVLKRFPTIQHLVTAGLLTVPESRVLKIGSQNYQVPIVWATSLINNASKNGRIRSNMDKDMLIRKINSIRYNCECLLRYDLVNLPLVYSQVVSFAVYIFCIFTFLGRYPFVKDGPKETHFPFFTFFQLTFYLSWLKVGQSMVNPYGDDDDDLDANLIIDLFINEALTIVDRLKTQIPTPAKDCHWNDVDFPMPENPTGQQGIYIGSAGGFTVDNDNGSTDDSKVEESQTALS